MGNKVKANVLKRNLPKTEAIVYGECASIALSPVALAKCVVKLLNARDRLNDEESRDSNVFEMYSEPKSQAGLYENFQKLLDEVMCRNNQVKMLKSDDQQVKEKPIEILARSKKSTFQRSALYNLQRVQRYTTMLDKYDKLLVKLNAENAKFIHEVSTMNIRFEVQPKQNLTMMDRVMELINNSFKNLKSDGRLKILSPKLFPILSNKKNRQHLLSPTLFSFQQDGYFSLPQLFQLASIGRNETDKWIEMLLTLSGADKELKQIVEALEPQINEFEQQVYPRLIELERWQRQLNRVKQIYNAEQQKQLKHDGYTFLTPNQMSLVYGSSLAPKLSQEAKLFARMSVKERERRVEDDIRNLAKLNSLISSNMRTAQSSRSKRAAQKTSVVDDQQSNNSSVDYAAAGQNVEVTYGFRNQNSTQPDEDDMLFESLVNGTFDSIYNCSYNDSDCNLFVQPASTVESKISNEQNLNDESKGKSEEKSEEKEELPKFETLKPFAFGSHINEAVVLEGPYAFMAEIVQPEALNFQVLSPRAFVPSILSPSALIARVLSPAAFRAEILSPRALVAWVLVPEALILEVLSPKALEMRIASPEALIIQILSPNTLAPKIYSPEALGVVVMSPSFLSPRIISKEKLMVEVLSPNILGGGSSEESKEESKEEEHKEHEPDEKHASAANPH